MKTDTKLDRAYVVLRLSKSFAFEREDANSNSEVVIENLLGFLPVFKTEANARAASNGGAYQILVIHIGTNNGIEL